MSEAAKGFWAMVAASVIWGLSGLFFKALQAVPPLEVLAHRTIWSTVMFALVLVFQGRLGVWAQAMRSPAVRIMALAALVISLNWFIYIWSVQSGHAVEASLGYYIFPLVAVLLGWLVAKEALGRAQWVAVGLAATAVTILGLGLGTPPWVALILAGSFGSYGLIKKRLDLGPVVSVMGEVTLLLPFALILVVGGHLGVVPPSLAEGHFGGAWLETLLLAASGLMTALPLMLFSYAARRVRMATVGLVQYINPTLQFTVAALIFLEPVTRWHGIALALIWTGLALYSWSSWRGKPARVPQDKALASTSSS